MLKFQIFDHPGPLIKDEIWQNQEIWVKLNCAQIGQNKDILVMLKNLLEFEDFWPPRSFQT